MNPPSAAASNHQPSPAPSEYRKTVRRSALAEAIGKPTTLESRDVVQLGGGCRAVLGVGRGGAGDDGPVDRANTSAGEAQVTDVP